MAKPRTKKKARKRPAKRRSAQARGEANNQLRTLVDRHPEETISILRAWMRQRH